MSGRFRSLLSQGRDLELRISEVYKVGQYDAAKAAIQLCPPTAATTGMKSANVEPGQLPASSSPTATALDPDLYDVDVVAVPIDTDPGDSYDPDYDPIPF